MAARLVPPSSPPSWVLAVGGFTLAIVQGGQSLGMSGDNGTHRDNGTRRDKGTRSCPWLGPR